MNKGLVGFFSILIALFIGAIYYNSTIQSPFISTLNYIKSAYHSGSEYIQDSIYKHFFQAKHIEELEEKVKDFDNNHLIMQKLASEVNDLYKILNSEFVQNPKVELVRVISYEKFSDFNKVWIDMPDYNQSKIYGLVYNELVAGIVVPQNKRPLGLLNKDIKSSYSVYVGKNKAPGIAHGNNNENLTVKFIPSWFNIKVGDEVVTSGLDDIFFNGLKVGKVISITKAQGYQNAMIKPYYISNSPNYFYLIRNTK